MYNSGVIIRHNWATNVDTLRKKAVAGRVFSLISQEDYAHYVQKKSSLVKALDVQHALRTESHTFGDLLAQIELAVARHNSDFRTPVEYYLKEPNLKPHAAAWTRHVTCERTPLGPMAHELEVLIDNIERIVQETAEDETSFSSYSDYSTDTSEPGLLD